MMIPQEVPDRKHAKSCKCVHCEAKRNRFMVPKTWNVARPKMKKVKKNKHELCNRIVTQYDSGTASRLYCENCDEVISYLS